MPVRAEDLRREERLSAELFQKWLERIVIKATWEPVEHDPPDLSFTIEREHSPPERWGVEVTSLFQYVDWEGKEGNRKNIEVPLQRLCELLKAHVPKSVTGYLIFGSGPHDADMRAIAERAVDYIRSGRTEPEFLDLPEAAEKFRHILKNRPDDPRLIASVQKLAEENAHFSIRAITKPAQVVWGAMLQGSAKIPNTDTMGADVGATLEYALGRILDAKLPRLKNVNGYERKLLLIWSGYFFADSARVKEILDTRNLTVQDVDSVLLIDDASDVHWVADPAGLFSPRPTRNDIAALAYDLWERRGRPFGSAEADWFEAERQLKV
jgi:hypothetical protein